MNFDEITLIEIEDYIQALDESVGLKVETIEDIRQTISKQRGLVKKLTIPDVMCSLTDDDKLELINNLRKETGWGMMDCRRALLESNWKMDDAKSWLTQFRKKPGIRFD
jgi:ribosomal protein L7/L12